jgi:uncharacterized iron-regulated protein
MQVKKQIKVLQTEAKDVANKLNKEVVMVTKGVQHIQAQIGIVYQLTSKAFDIQKLSKECISNNIIKSTIFGG